MEIKTLSNDFAVTAQIDVTDIQAIKKAGFKAVICNRPDDEAPDQPAFAAIKAAAEAAGLQALHIPVVPGEMDESHITAFEDAMNELPQPVLGYCRSGGRATALWTASAVSQAAA